MCLERQRVTSALPFLFFQRATAVMAIKRGALIKRTCSELRSHWGACLRTGHYQDAWPLLTRVLARRFVLKDLYRPSLKFIEEHPQPLWRGAAAVQVVIALELQPDDGVLRRRERAAVRMRGNCRLPHGHSSFAACPDGSPASIATASA